MVGKSYRAHGQCPKAWLFLQDPDCLSVELGAARLLQGQQIRTVMDLGGQDKSSKGNSAHLGISRRGGDRQARWKARGQPSQQMSSPPSWHTAHSSSFF